MHVADTVILADKAFTAGDFDFASLHGTPDLLLDRPTENGVSLIMAHTTSLPDDAIDALLSWRLGQYLLTGFYDPEVIASGSMTKEPRDSVHDGDIHALALDEEGALLTYITMKQPEGAFRDTSRTYRDTDRPLFPCEESHGRSWQRNVLGVDDVPLGAVWELARFVRDQRRLDDPLGHRGALEVALASARLARHPDHVNNVQLVTGDLDPEVALMSLRFFFIPVATFTPHQVHLEEGHPLAPRYRDHLTAPFVATPEDVDYTAYIRWADIDLALDRDDEEATKRLLALRQFVSVKESSLKRPGLPKEDSIFPVDALVSPASQDASAALWRSGSRGAIPWRAVRLGPGDRVDPGEALWVVDGYVQARMKGPTGPFHLAAIGPQVAYIPLDGMGDVFHLEAISPVKALITTRENFEDFWRQRQQLFDTSTESLYGEWESS